MATLVELILSAKNNASPQIKQLAADVAQLDKNIGALSSVASAGLGMAGFAAAIAGVQQLGQAIADTSQAGASFDRLGESFTSLSAEFGTSGQSILSAIEGVTQGTLSQKTIMQQANNAMLLGVADTADEFETLAKIAVDRGRAMGISMEYAFESIVKGVGRLSPLILDNLGIVLDADTTYAKYAATIGKTADALTDMEKRAALISRLKEEVTDFDAGSVMDAAGSWERLGASIEGASIAVGEWLNSSTPLLSALNQMSNTLDILAANFSDNVGTEIKAINVQIQMQQDIIDDSKRAIEEYAAAAAKGDFGAQILSTFDSNEANLERATRQLEELIAKKRELEMSAANGTNWWRDVSVGATAQADALRLLENEYSQVADTVVNWYAKALGISREEALASIQSTIALKGSWAAAAPAIAEAGNAAILAAQRIAQATSLLNSAMSTMQSAALQAYSDSGYQSGIIEQYRTQAAVMEGMQSTLESMDPTEATFLMRQMTDQGTAGFKAVSEYANQTEKAIGGAGSATKSLTKEFSNLSGIVGGLVDTAMSDFGGADLAEFLPYQDAPAEDARRIASVMVEGWDSEWADYFKTKFPDLFTKYMGLAGGDIQKASALLLQDFQNGLNPELLDKGKIKEMAKRLFLADEATSKMVDEIARDLANEMGISIEQATAAVGGAAGVKKKPMTREEVEKMFTGIDLSPKWDMTNSKEKFKEAGKKAGVLNENGDLLVPVKVEFTSLESNMITGDYKIQISGFELKDAASFKTNLESKLSNITLGFSPNPSTEFYTGLQTNIFDYVAGKTATIKFAPAAYDPVPFENWVAGVENFISAIDVNINPTMSTETFESVFAPIRTALQDTFINQETADTMIFNLAAALGLGIFNNPDGFNWQGKYIGNLMISNFEEANVGQLLANSLANQLTQAQRTFEISAASSGKVWGNAFLSTVKANVPMELINILTDLVTPQVAKKMGDSKDRGGAEK